MGGLFRLMEASPCKQLEETKVKVVVERVRYLLDAWSERQRVDVVNGISV